MIGKLLGHADIQSTARYAHLARETERVSAARVGASIGADIAPGRGRREGRRVVNYSASQPARGSITECVVDALPAGRDTVIWDRALTGFGVRVYPSGAKVYVVQTRGPAGTKRITVGRHGVIGAAEARRRAALIIARVQGRRGPRRAPGPKTRRPHPCRARRALPARACRGALQALHRRPVQARHRALYRARPRRARGLRNRAQPCRRSAARAPRPPRHGQPGDRDALAPDRSGRGLGRGSGDHQPLPLGPKIQGAPARALPHRRRVPPLRPAPWTSWRRPGGSRPMRHRPSACSCSPAAGATRS